MSAPNAQSYWLLQYQAADPQFQGGPFGSDLATTQAGSFVAWPKGASLPLEASEGDVVFIWRAAGNDSGLQGWGVIGQGVTAREPPYDLLPPGDIVLGITTRLNLAPEEPPIPRAQLAQRPELADAPLIRQNQTGTSFRLSVEQAFGIAKLLADRGLAAPEIATEAVVDSLRRRLMRELSGMHPYLSDVEDKELAARIRSLSDAASSRLSSDAPFAALSDLGEIAAQLDAIVKTNTRLAQSGLDAARARIAVDVDQLIGLARRRLSAEATEMAEDVAAAATTGPPDRPAGDQSVAMAPAAAPSDHGVALIEPAEPASGAGDAGAPPLPDVPAVVESAAPAPPPAAPPPVAPPSATGELQPPKDPAFVWWEEKDLIGIGAEVNNLARYIAHEALVPPRAIGVFGDWGSGKSFFIEALRSQIALLASQSRDALKAGGTRPSVFCSHIVQIEFNAWHYVESNLWASLAAHIFEKLYAELERRAAEEEGNKNVDGLFQQFTAYRQAVSEQSRLKDLIGILGGRRDDALEKKRTAEQALGRRLSALAGTLTEKLGGIAANRLDAREREQLQKMVEASRVGDLDAASASASEVVRDGQGIVGRIRTQLDWWGKGHLALFIGVIAAVVIGSPILFAHILSQDQVLAWISVLGTYVGSAALTFTWLSRGGRSLVTTAKKIMDVVDETRATVEATPDPDLTAAQADLAAAESDLRALDKHIDEQRERLGKLTDDLDPTRLGMRLRNFLEDRVKNGAYNQHLGLVSLVRRDFAEIYELMRRHWVSRKQPAPEALAEVKDALGVSSEQPVPFIERIVLYIDDLDRCPETKVVEVLQAVHLMLGLPLFVVVVAVDVRWVGRSIRKHYGDLLSSEEVLANRGSGALVTDGAATTDDYLEKIFQIPYRIHPMEAQIRGQLLSGLLREPYLAALPNVAAEGQRFVTQQELLPKELSLYPEEQAAIGALRDCVGSSPRRVRRFLDVYRLMRAGMEEGEVQDVLNGRHYHAILALFAMLSGAPLLAPRVIELIHREALRFPIDDPVIALEFKRMNLAEWIEMAFRELGANEATPERAVIRSALRFLDEQTFDRAELVTILRR